MKRLLLLFIGTLLFCSCGVDDSKIIGKKISPMNMPYGEFGFGGYKYIDGVHYDVYCAYYRNKALVYVLDKDSYVRDYFFSNLVKYDKVKDFPLGSRYEEVVAKLGEPVFLKYDSFLYKFPAKIQSDDLMCIYFQRTFNRDRLRYELDKVNAYFLFDSDGLLSYVTQGYETDGGTVVLDFYRKYR
jgi:hypothetical protein